MHKFKFEINSNYFIKSNIPGCVLNNIHKKGNSFNFGNSIIK